MASGFARLKKSSAADPTLSGEDILPAEATTVIADDQEAVDNDQSKPQSPAEPAVTDSFESYGDEGWADQQSWFDGDQAGTKQSPATLADADKAAFKSGIPSFQRAASVTDADVHALHNESREAIFDGYGFVCTNAKAGDLGVQLRTLYPDQLASFRKPQMEPVNFFQATPQEGEVPGDGLNNIAIGSIELSAGLEDFSIELNAGAAVDQGDSIEAISFEGLRAGATDRARWLLEMKSGQEQSRYVTSTWQHAKQLALRSLASDKEAAIAFLKPNEGEADKALKSFKNETLNTAYLSEAIEEAMGAACFAIVENGQPGCGVICDRMTKKPLLGIRVTPDQIHIRLESDFANAADVHLKEAHVNRNYTQDADIDPETGKPSRSIVLSFDFGSNTEDAAQKEALRKNIPEMVRNLCAGNRPVIEQAHAMQVTQRANKALENALTFFPMALERMDISKARHSLDGGQESNIAHHNAVVSEMARTIRSKSDDPVVKEAIAKMPHYSRAVLAWIGEKDSPSSRDIINMTIGQIKRGLNESLAHHTKNVVNVLDGIARSRVLPPQADRMPTFSQILEEDKRRKVEARAAAAKNDEPGME